MKKTYYIWGVGICAFLITMGFDFGAKHPMACIGVIWGSLLLGEFFDSVLAAIKEKK